MFRDDKQKAKVCCVLNAFIATKLWTDAGPTPVAISLAERDGGGMSSGEKIMFLLAWHIWTHEPVSLQFADIFRLSPERQKLIGSFIIASSSGSDALDEWINVWGSDN